MTMQGQKGDKPKVPPTKPSWMPTMGTQLLQFGGMQPLMGAGGYSEVEGFSAATVECRVVTGLPTDVFVPGEALGVVYAAKRLDVWLDTGKRVQEWAAAHGGADASWIDEGSDGVRIPPELAGGDVPSFVHAWVADVPEMESILADMVSLP